MGALPSSVCGFRSHSDHLHRLHHSQLGRTLSGGPCLGSQPDLQNGALLLYPCAGGWNSALTAGLAGKCSLAVCPARTEKQWTARRLNLPERHQQSLHVLWLLLLLYLLKSVSTRGPGGVTDYSHGWAFYMDSCLYFLRHNCCTGNHSFHVN